MIDDKFCGSVPEDTKMGQWYNVKCKEPVYGKKVRLVSTKNKPVSIQGIEAFSGSPPVQ
jgi:hypothetical protein